MPATITLIDGASGNEISGVTLENDVTFIDTPSACGGAIVNLTANPQTYDQFNGNGIDCTTAERIHYDALTNQPVTAPATTLTATRSKTFWFDVLDAAPGSAWQDHDPAVGARLALQSGQPLLMSADQSYLPPAPGTSLYRQLCSYYGADYNVFTEFVASANTDNVLETQLRFVDNNNKIILRYTPATTTWDLIQKIAGVETILASASHDLTAHGTAGVGFLIHLLGPNITIQAPSPVLLGTFATAHLSAGPMCFFIDANGANASGFGGTSAGQLNAIHP